MDSRKLSLIDEELGSSEVEALCFLCLDVLNRKRLEGIKSARDLFLKLEKKGLMDNDNFILQLLRIIQRPGLVRLLEPDSQQAVETDALPLLSKYRVMLYKIYEDMTKENLDKLKFLLSDKLPRRQMEKSNTALDVFYEMEKAELLSQTNVDGLHQYLLQFDQMLASLVKNYKGGPESISHASMDNQNANNCSPPHDASLSIPETKQGFGGLSISSDAQPSTKSSSPPNETVFYHLNNFPRGLCVIISNENFNGPELNPRRGTKQDEKTIEALFTKFGFTVDLCRNLTANAMKEKVKQLGQRDFRKEDALVVFVLSHGESGCVFGTDEKKVLLEDLKRPFTSLQAQSLAGKPKLFLIQACRGKNYQKGGVPCPFKPAQNEMKTPLEEDSGPIHVKTIPENADFLLGMATVEDCKSFRHVTDGSIYIQALCRTLEKSAESPTPDDILSILTRVNKEVSEFDTQNNKQMPEPTYTLTKKLVLTFVNGNMK